MRFAYNLNSNSAPVVKKFQVGETMANAGVPVLVGGSGNEGIALASTTAAVDLVGVTLDTATLVTAQQSDNSDTERTVSVIINPGAVYKAKLSGGATDDTALALHTVTTASTTGLVVTTATAWDSPTFDEGLVFGYEGANAGKGRKITSVSSTAGTILVAFPNDTAVGDTFMRLPFVSSPYGMEDQFVQITTNLTQVDASVAVDTDNANFRVVELKIRDAASQGRTNSFAFLLGYGSIYSGGLV